MATTLKAIPIKSLQRKKRIVIVEDERELADLVSYNLRAAGYEPAIVHDGRSALDLIRQAPPDLVILDIMLPELSGIEVAQRLRGQPGTRSVPILMMTAKAEESDQISGLNAGADDYVTKPFSLKVLLARVEALLRRAPEPQSTLGLLRLHDVTLNPETHEVQVGGSIVPFTLTEFRLLHSLLKSGGKVLSRAHLVQHAMGPGVVVTDRTIDVHMTAIRRKLGETGHLIKTVRGVGYRAVSPNE
jgi:two-component system phosphate regulon response regulator PhoB